MAKRVVEETIDDLDGTSRADERVEIGLQGKWYELDLSAKHAQKLRDLLAPYIAAGRSAAKASGRHVKREDYDEIRRWARANGVPVSEHGRIAADVIRRYDARNEGGGPLTVVS